MIRLNSFLHRHTLADITGRWLCDRLEPGDVRTLKELVNYNCLLAPLVLDDVASSIFTEMVGLPVQSFAASTKGALKDFLVAHPPHTSHRIEEMIRRYQKYPQDFYRETPFDGRVYHQSTGASPKNPPAASSTTCSRRSKRRPKRSPTSGRCSSASRWTG
jgi:hypothetical protein